VQRRHFNGNPARCFLLEDAEEVMERVLPRTARAIAAVTTHLRVAFPPQWLADTIFAGIVRNMKPLGDIPN
jgi:hypothetical protein